MGLVFHSSLLHRALLADAVVSGATGLALALGAPWLSGRLGLPEELLRGAGMFLVPFAALVGVLGARALPSHGVVWAVVVVNALWVLGSVGLLVAGGVTPTLLGTLFVLAQALIVAVFAEVQFIAVRRTPLRTRVTE